MAPGWKSRHRPEPPKLPQAGAEPNRASPSWRVCFPYLSRMCSRLHFPSADWSRKSPIPGGIRTTEKASSPYLSRCGRGVISRREGGERYAERREEAAGLDTHPKDDGGRRIRAGRASSGAGEARAVVPGEEAHCRCGGPPLALGEGRIVEVRPSLPTPGGTAQCTRSSA